MAKWRSPWLQPSVSTTQRVGTGRRNIFYIILVLAAPLSTINQVLLIFSIFFTHWRFLTQAPPNVIWTVSRTAMWKELLSQKTFSISISQKVTKYWCSYLCFHTRALNDLQAASICMHSMAAPETWKIAVSRIIFSVFLEITVPF